MEGYAAIVAEHFFGELIKTQKLLISNVGRTEEATILTIHPKIILNVELMLRLDANVSCVDIHVVLKSVSKMKRYKPKTFSTIYGNIVIVSFESFKPRNDVLQEWNRSGF